MLVHGCIVFPPPNNSSDSIHIVRWQAQTFHVSLDRHTHEPSSPSRSSRPHFVAIRPAPNDDGNSDSGFSVSSSPAPPPPLLMQASRFKDNTVPDVCSLKTNFPCASSPLLLRPPYAPHHHQQQQTGEERTRMGGWGVGVWQMCATVTTTDGAFNHTLGCAPAPAQTGRT